MVLKAVLFSFNGIMINDEAIRETLSNQLLLDENLRPDEDDYRQVCLGRSDRACLKGLLAQRGRTMNDEGLDKLLVKKSAAYQDWLDGLEKLPLYPGLDDLIFRCRAAQVKMAIVTGAQRQQVISVLNRTEFSDYFSVIVAGEDVSSDNSKPAPDSYLQAIAQLNARYPDLNVQPDECIAIEAFFAGVEAAQTANIAAVGVAHVYPNHMLQRRATWVVDYLREIKLDWIGEKFGGEPTNTDFRSSDFRSSDSKSTDFKSADFEAELEAQVEIETEETEAETEIETTEETTSEPSSPEPSSSEPSSSK
ncbi:MAG: HAD family phosphatase [Phormidesmis sp.]